MVCFYFHKFSVFRANILVHIFMKCFFLFSIAALLLLYDVTNKTSFDNTRVSFFFYIYRLFFLLNDFLFILIPLPFRAWVFVMIWHPLISESFNLPKIKMFSTHAPSYVILLLHVLVQYWSPHWFHQSVGHCD